MITDSKVWIWPPFLKTLVSVTCIRRWHLNRWSIQIIVIIWIIWNIQWLALIIMIICQLNALLQSLELRQWRSIWCTGRPILPFQRSRRLSLKHQGGQRLFCDPFPQMCPWKEQPGPGTSKASWNWAWRIQTGIVGFCSFSPSPLWLTPDLSTLIVRLSLS